MDLGQRGRFRIRNIGNGLAHQRLYRGPAVQRGKRLVDRQVTAIQVFEPDLERKIVQHGVQKALALAQFILQRKLARDVGANADHGDRCTELVLHQCRAQGIKHFGAVGPDVAYLALPGTLGQRGVEDLLVRGVGERAVAVIRYMLA